MAKVNGYTKQHELNRMQTDAVLPQDIRPELEQIGNQTRLAFLTGACGFLGSRLVLELLNHTNLQIVCLVRNTEDEPATTRLARILSDMGVDQKVMKKRIEVIVGDVTEPEFGLDADLYTDLSKRVDAIYHCAAQVDWVRSYIHLYRINVGSVLAMIKFACQGRLKRLVFVSSMAVCYSSDGPDNIDEHTDMLPFIGSMPLGYAQSKCVAESLLRQASNRGVPITVLRPTLIAGDSSTGVASPSDLIAALLQSCISTSMAIDTDWMFDCVPVDFVAKVIARLPQGDSTWQVLHLMHEHPRYWQELILWINLYGYPVELVKSDTWIKHLFEKQNARGTLLYALRHFFRGVTTNENRAAEPRPYEVYLANNQDRINAKQTRSILRKFGLYEAALDADLLHAYFNYYRRIGVLPQNAKCGKESLTLDKLHSGSWAIHGISGGADRWTVAEQRIIGTNDGLLNEIATARMSGSFGLRRLCFRDMHAADTHSTAFAVLKVKVSDKLLQDLSAEVAHVCRPELGKLFAQYRDAFGLTQSHERELAIYELDEPRLHRHIPTCYGTLRNPDEGHWALLLEYLPEAAEKKARPRLLADNSSIKTILNGLADIHAIWYQRFDELTEKSWLVTMPETSRMQEIIPLWTELADFAAPQFESWCGPDIRKLQTNIINSIAQWWPHLCSLPSTLIHNDFNPRNFVLQQSNGQQQLCVYDWELATLGIPQHDLAELLCYTWDANMSKQDLDILLETYRKTLSSASEKKIDASEWREGFTLALRHLLINRFALYTLMYRFRPLNYLPQVMTNWMRLYSWS